MKVMNISKQVTSVTIELTKRDLDIIYSLVGGTTETEHIGSAKLYRELGGLINDRD